MRPVPGIGDADARAARDPHFRHAPRPLDPQRIAGGFARTLHLETVGGAPVDLCDVTVDGGMPQHGHGLPTKPKVTRQLGNGDHVVEGMKFNMGGWWVVKFRVSSAAGNDSLVFNLKL